MSFFRVFDVSASAMKAQSVRLNTTASNLANADSISNSAEGTYRARKPVFAAELQNAQHSADSVGVQVAGIVESDAPLRMEYYPEHPLANEEGYIFKPNVNVIEEMADMMSASRNYQANVQVTEAAKQMLNSTLTLGRGNS
ncbi:flagellar basal body rod protein FlgC [Aliagarivorans marinus]|uniref:flagellar basal body rod protein FlgC n=1 Tax=Aliagarivorans marinus TaxID=561965 RepID=UPI0003FE9B71|nr:flagellar basal body rod protein FlgC [Aliagarivorans marinus]